MAGSIAGRVRRVLARVRDVQQRYSAIGGPTLAAGVTLYGFLALFAILVLAIAALGYLSVNNEDLATTIADDLGLTGDAAGIITDGVDAAQRSRNATTVIGVLGLVWLGTTWAGSIANAYNAAWRVAGRGFRDRAHGVLWLAGTIAFLGAAGGATALWALLPGFLAPLVVVVSLVANAALWLWTSRVLPNRPFSLRAAWPGALVGAVALEVLKVLGSYVVPRYITRSSELYGAIGVIIAVLLWLLIFGRVVLYVAVIEAERGTR
jgi:membrane protein